MQLTFLGLELKTVIMKKLTLCSLVITLLFIPGLTFSQEIINDTIVKEIPDTLQQQIPDTLQQTIPDAVTKKEAKITNYSKGWGISLKASTLGLGLEVIRRQNQFFSFRLGATYFSYKREKTDTEFEVEKTYNVDLSGVTLIADWFVFGHLSSFHVSGGVAYNATTMDVTGYPINKYTIGSYDIPPEQLGDVIIKLTPNNVSPYLGAGFGNFISSNKKLTFNLQLGILYQDSPMVEFLATGMIEPTAEQVDIVAQNVEGFIFYPVLDVQITYKIK